MAYCFLFDIFLSYEIGVNIDKILFSLVRHQLLLEQRRRPIHGWGTEQWV